MNDQLLNLSKLFTNTVIRIPDYQRGYAWTNKEYEDFWNDLINLETGKKYYAGVITTEEVKPATYKSETWIEDEWLIENKNYQPIYIVDGQQRLTSSILLIQAIIDVVEEKHSCQQINYYSIESIKNTYLYEYKGNTNNFSVKFGYEKNNPCHGFLIEEIYNIKSLSGLEVLKTKYSENLMSAFKFFKNKISKLDFNNIENIFSKLTQHFVYNLFKIQEDIDVFVTFETMNNRGKRLSNLELLKNRLIYLTTLLKESAFDINANKILRNEIDNCWKDIYYFLGRNPEKMLEDEQFLYIHFNQYFKDTKNEKNAFYPRSAQNENLLRNIFTPQKVRNDELGYSEIQSYVINLKESVKDWYHINFPTESSYPDDIKEYLIKINYLIKEIQQKLKSTSDYHAIVWRRGYGLNNLYSTEIVYRIFDNIKDNSLRLNILKILERLLFVSYTFDVHYEYVNNFFQSLDEILKAEDTSKIKEIISKLNNFYEDYWKQNQNSLLKTYNKLVNSSTNGGYYNSWFLLKYFLAEYEIDCLKRSKNIYKVEDLKQYYQSEFYNVEHIYPSNARADYWTRNYKQYSSREKKKLRNSLGNLVIISIEKNGKMANKSFPEKKSNPQNTIGYKYGCLSERELCNHDDWTYTEIKKRGIDLLVFIENRWLIKLGRKITKIEMLGLLSFEPPKNKEH